MYRRSTNDVYRQFIGSGGEAALAVAGLLGLFLVCAIRLNAVYSHMRDLHENGRQQTDAETVTVSV